MSAIEEFEKWCEQLPDPPARVRDKAFFEEFEKSIKEQQPLVELLVRGETAKKLKLAKHGWKFKE